MTGRMPLNRALSNEVEKEAGPRCWTSLLMPSTCSIHVRGSWVPANNFGVDISTARDREAWSTHLEYAADDTSGQRLHGSPGN